MSTEHATKIIQKYQDLLSQKNIVITDINPSNLEDRSLVLEATLRGKTVDEYFQIVDGIFTQMNQVKDGKDEKNKTEWNRLHEIVSKVMSIGERVLGIDWS
ncbi:MAG: hypothetical protein Q8Q30_00950 [Candidatus Woesebacteria bacterium]|nr:hypothetical protein [Candidatus Woesebacteria bacterium]